MYKPIVAIVGRPNVGKSTFFNRIIGKRISIVQDEPGVTRDRVYGDAEWAGIEFSLVDTGGIDLKSTDEMKKHIFIQAQIAIDIADVILFFVDAKDGLVANDYDVSEILRKSKNYRFENHIRQRTGRGIRGRRPRPLPDDESRPGVLCRLCQTGRFLR